MTSDTDPLELASALHVAGRLAQAEPYYRQAIAASPHVRVAHSNLVQLLESQRRWDDLEAALRAALEIWPDDPKFAPRLGGVVLAGGRYEEGFQLYEARRATPGVAPPPRLSAPEWEGAPVENLLVWSEQGLGDSIQFARYIPLVEARGVKVAFICQNPLARLMRGAGLNAIGSREGVSIPSPDAWVLAGSLPRVLGSTLQTLPPPLAVATKPGGSGFGVVTRGSPEHKNDANRSLPAEIAAEVLAHPGARSLHPEDTGALDFQDTAEIIAGLAAVLSVDTAVAHLAASMGKPTFILLPDANPDWRWLRERSDSPWYPSARLYRQDHTRDWRPVLNRALHDLTLIGARPA